MFKKEKNEENILLIPSFCNKDKKYNIIDTYTPRKFDSTDEFIKHIENLRKLQNYDIINEQLEIIDKSVYRNIINNKLKEIKFKEHINRSIKEEECKLKIAVEKKNRFKKIKERGASPFENKYIKEKNRLPKIY